MFNYFKVINITMVFLFSNNSFSDSMCFEKAKKAEKDAGKNISHQMEYLQKAQNFYLCAEKEGNVYAGYKAASLSGSGMTDKLEEKDEIRMFENAGNAGNADAALVLSGIYCGMDVFACKNPKEAKIWLIKSVRLGSATGANQLGVFYERGYDGEINIDKAAACFKYSSEKGDDLGRKNYLEIKVKFEFTKTIDCVNAGEIND